MNRRAETPPREETCDASSTDACDPGSAAQSGAPEVDSGPGASVEELQAEIRALRKQLRKRDRSISRMEETLRTSGELADRNKRMMFRALQDAAHELEERRRTESELRLATRAAEDAATAKSAFLANMSHELRTPMNGVLGMLELLGLTSLDPRQRDLARTATASAQDLLALLNDILDFSKIEAGQLAVEAIPFNVWDAVDDVCAAPGRDALKKAVDFEVSVEPNVPAAVRCDPVRYRQILTNLVGNAVKFTDAGCVRVRVAYDAETQWLRTEVEDTGIGIPADRLEAIFAPFSQADATTTRRFGGTGLGLSIARQLCDLLSGELTVTSRPGEGTTFCFGFPAERIEQNFPVNADLAGVLVACVGRDEGEQSRLVTLLASLGCAFVDGSTGQVPTVMVQTAGYRRANTGEAAPTIAISDGGTGDDADLYTSQVVRPVRRRALEAALLEVLSQEAAAPIAGEHPLSGTVLLVEDNPVNRLLALKYLERLGDLKVHIAENGERAVAMMESHDYDLVLMDCHMPVMDGLEATRRVRASLPGARQPVIVAMTANAMKEDRRACSDAGMNDYLAKPVSYVHFEALMRKWLPAGTTA